MPCGTCVMDAITLTTCPASTCPRWRQTRSLHASTSSAVWHRHRLRELCGGPGNLTVAAQSPAIARDLKPTARRHWTAIGCNALVPTKHGGAAQLRRSAMLVVEQREHPGE